MSLPALQVASRGNVHLEEERFERKPFGMLAPNARFGVQ